MILKKNYILTVLNILLGSFFMAITINALFIPHKILSGGVTGIAMLLHYIFDLPISLMVILINIPLFIIGYMLVNKKFIIHSIIGTCSLSLFLHLTRNFTINTNEIITIMLLGGVIYGIGLGLIFRVNASTGGSDIIAKILNKYFSISMATVCFLINIIVIGASVFYFNIDLAVYTLTTLYISSILTTFVVEGINYKRTVLIITNKDEQVSKKIISKLHRGVTIIPCKGAFTGSDRKILYCVISKRQIAKLRYIVKEIDDKAFVTVTETAQVYGNGRGFYDIHMD